MDKEYESWSKDQTPENMGHLLSAAQPVIDRAVTSYAGGDKGLTSRAKILASKAFQLRVCIGAAQIYPTDHAFDE